MLICDRESRRDCGRASPARQRRVTSAARGVGRLPGRVKSSPSTSTTWTGATAAPRSGARGSAVDVIVWQAGTARLLPKLLDGRARRPVFLTSRRARVALAPADLDPVSGRARLSYRRAEEVFTERTKPLAHPGHHRSPPARRRARLDPPRPAAQRAHPPRRARALVMGWLTQVPTCPRRAVRFPRGRTPPCPGTIQFVILGRSAAVHSGGVSSLRLGRGGARCSSTRSIRCQYTLRVGTRANRSNPDNTGFT